MECDVVALISIGCLMRRVGDAEKFAEGITPSAKGSCKAM